MEAKTESVVTQLCPTLCDPVDCSLPGSSAHGILQARVLERGAIAFSESMLMKLYVYLETCLSSRFMSIVLWPGMTHMVPMLSQNACCG